jgi:hypothetical protein
VKHDVTERDLRMPEFRDAKLEDLEFRADGKIVRKDRWERGIVRIAHMVGFNSRDGFEIDEVVEKVRVLVKTSTDWALVADTETEDIPIAKGGVDIELFCGSVLKVATFNPDSERWVWGQGLSFKHSQVKSWRIHLTEEVSL